MNLNKSLLIILIFLASCSSNNDFQIINSDNNVKIEEIEKTQNIKVASEVYPFQKFWKAENYHQNYERLHPNNSYVRNVSIPRLKRFKAKFPKLLKSNH